MFEGTRTLRKGDFQMTATEKFFLELLSFHIGGKEPTETEFNASELFGLAVKHKLVPIIYSALKKSGVPLGPEDTESFKNGTRIECAVGIRKEVSFHRLLSDLEESGISPIVVKGVILSSLYPEKSTRFSTDQDLLFTKEQLEKARSVFEKNGLIKNDAAEDDTVRAYRAPQSGLYIEAHTSLFPEYPSHNRVMNSMFENAFKNSVITNVGGAPVRSLCPTEHLQFLILHSFKHFIYCGFGIRQVMDFIVYAKAKKELIDTKTVISNLSKVNALGFFDALLTVCKEYFGQAQEELGFYGYVPNEYDTVDLIADILSGGAYGNSTKERLHSSKMTLSATENGKSASILSSLFPPVGIMKSTHPYLEKHPYLLPAAWCSRIINHLKKDKRNRSFNAGETIEIGKERLRMMKKYGIIE